MVSEQVRRSTGTWLLTNYRLATDYLLYTLYALTYLLTYHLTYLLTCLLTYYGAPRLQATLVTVNDFDRDRGPWRWGGSHDIDEYSPGVFSHVRFRGPP